MDFDDDDLVAMAEEESSYFEPDADEMEAEIDLCFGAQKAANSKTFEGPDSSSFGKKLQSNDQRISSSDHENGREFTSISKQSADLKFIRSLKFETVDLSPIKSAHEWRSEKCIDAILSSRCRVKTVDPIDSLMSTSALITQTPIFKAISNSASSVLSRSDLNEQCVSCTTGRGARVFFRRIDSDQILSDLHQSKQAKRSDYLLSSPINELIERAERNKIELMSRELVESEVKIAGRNSDSLSTSCVSEGRLWVDKYAPNNFSQLLSDERINREVLRAVKAWDDFVFGKRGDSQNVNNPKHTLISKSNGKPIDEPTYSTPKFQTKSKLKSDRDAFVDPARKFDRRPEHRIILLCGAPGMGKTTLAHIIAMQAGYHPLEINASDDRTATVLKDKIIRAMENKSLFSIDRPNLIILDEVDGAEDKAAIDAILTMVNAPLNIKDSAKLEGSQVSSREKKGHPLTRPIILICNNQYAPHLRAVRQTAIVFNFKKTSSHKLARRLSVICKAESFEVSQQALLALCEATGNDIRACLNMLQFVAQRSRNLKQTENLARPDRVCDISIALLSALGNGMKDEGHDIFQVWNSIFQQNYASKSGIMRAALMASMPQKTEESRQKKTESGASFVVKEIEQFNEHRRVLEGVHENYLDIRYNDPSLRRTMAAADWVSFADTMDTLNHYTLHRYIPSAIAGVHIHCRVDSRPAKTRFLSAYSMAYTSTENRKATLMAFDLQREPCASGRGLATPIEVIPLGVRTLAPRLRNVPKEMLHPPEKKRLEALVNSMLIFGLTFIKRNNVGELEGHDMYDLEPPIDEFVKYASQPLSYIPLPPSLQQLVAHEIEFEKLRRQGRSAGDQPAPSNLKRNLISIDSFPEQDAKRLRDDARRAAARPFWQKDENAERALQKQKKFLRFKFQSGFTNAVKRNVRMKDLM